MSSIWCYFQDLHCITIIYNRTYVWVTGQQNGKNRSSRKNTSLCKRHRSFSQDWSRKRVGPVKIKIIISKEQNTFLKSKSLRSLHHHDLFVRSQVKLTKTANELYLTQKCPTNRNKLSEGSFCRDVLMYDTHSWLVHT